MKTTVPKPKKVWTSPKLVVYGSVNQITQAKIKHLGAGDDVILVIPPNPNPIPLS